MVQDAQEIQVIKLVGAQVAERVQGETLMVIRTHVDSLVQWHSLRLSQVGHSGLGTTTPFDSLQMQPVQCNQKTGKLIRLGFQDDQPGNSTMQVPKVY